MPLAVSCLLAACNATLPHTVSFARFVPYCGYHFRRCPPRAPPVCCGVRLGLPSGTTALSTHSWSSPAGCRQEALPCPCCSPSPPWYLPTRGPRVSPAQLKRPARHRILDHLELGRKSSSIGPVPWVDPSHRTLTRPPSSWSNRQASFQDQPPRWAGRTTPPIPMPPPSGP